MVLTSPDSRRVCRASLSRGSQASDCRPTQLNEWVDRSPVSGGRDLYVTDVRGGVSALSSEGQIKWQVDGRGGRLITGASPLLSRSDEYLVARDPDTGETTWQLYMGDKVKGPVVGPNGELLLLDQPENRTQYALRRIDPSTGRTSWSQTIPHLKLRPITIAGDKIIVASSLPGGATEVSAFDLETGEPKYSFRAEQVDRIQHKDGRLLFFSITRRPRNDVWELQERDAHTGELNWAYKPLGRVRSTPTWSQDGSKVLLFESVKNRLDTQLLAFDAKSGDKAWALTTGLSQNLALGRSGEIYFHHTEFNSETGDATAYLHRVNPDNGRYLWTREADSPPRWAQVESDGDLLTATREGQNTVVRCYDDADGSLRWQSRHGLVSELQLGAEDRLHLLDGGCNLKVLDPETGATTTSFGNGNLLNLGPVNERGQIPLVDHQGEFRWLATGPAGELPGSQPLGSVAAVRTLYLERELAVNGEGKIFADWQANGGFEPRFDPVLLRDRDGDGQIGATELEAPPNWAELESLDSNGDGRLSGPEMQGIFWHYEQEEGPPTVIEDGYPYDKARILLSERRLDLAANSRCQ